MSHSILITGGAGFIGSHVVRYFVSNYPDYTIVNLDALTYAGNLNNLIDVSDSPNYYFQKGDICDGDLLATLFGNYDFNGIIHLAAESHVDRSIKDPQVFVQTNIMGTISLLTAARIHWKNVEDKRFYHISTDEVYGSLDATDCFKETTAYDPQSPYSASKASSDHFVRAFHNTYGLPIVLSNCSNNYGPYQFPEKLIPLAINNIKTENQIPIYGKGRNSRDWLFVEDHVFAIDRIYHQGKNGETYTIGSGNEWENIDLIRMLCDIMDEKLKKKAGSSQGLITYVPDRAGHDMRYAIDSSKISRELGWKPSLQFEEGIRKTVDWYLANEQWLSAVTSGDYLHYYEEHYKP